MRRIRILFLIIAFVIGLTACRNNEVEMNVLEEAELKEAEDTAKTDARDFIYVYVCGAVLQPGVYELPYGSRVYEAIAMAGGLREDAASNEVNQAEVLVDGAKLYVPTLTEIVNNQAEEDGKVNLNSATKDELMTLPGVGQSRAESIIQYRNDNGGFKAIEEIMQVSGIKEGLFEKIRDLITV